MVNCWYLVKFYNIKSKNYLKLNLLKKILLNGIWKKIPNFRELFLSEIIGDRAKFEVELYFYLFLNFRVKLGYNKQDGKYYAIKIMKNTGKVSLN